MPGARRVDLDQVEALKFQAFARGKVRHWNLAGLNAEQNSTRVNARGKHAQRNEEREYEKSARKEVAVEELDHLFVRHVRQLRVIPKKLWRGFHDYEREEEKRGEAREDQAAELVPANESPDKREIIE